MSGLSESIEWLVPGSVFIASLVGSPHCLAMCGPLALGLNRTPLQLSLYHAGRGLTYISAGALAGAVGEKALHGIQLPWLGSLSIGFLALYLLAAGVANFRGKPLHLPVKMPGFVLKLFRASDKTPFLRPLLAGALTIFLPCGHLYGFIAGALATGNALHGAVFMGFFWAGTLPALAIGPRFIRQLMSRLGRGGTRWAGALLIVAGLFSLFAFASRLDFGRGSTPASASRLKCH